MTIFKNIQPIDISELPVQKRIASMTIDCFDIPVMNCSHYFLSHFHSDHYTRLSKSFEHHVYCSKTTAELVSSRIGAQAIGLDMYKTYSIGTFHVMLIEANHCPGAVLFLFLIDSKYFLHTGDFRYDPKYHNFASKVNISFKSIYLDNTYENFIHFPSQKEAISKILNIFNQKGKLCPLNICVLCCSYSVGKEKIFLSIAEYLDKKVQVTEDKMSIYKCYDSYTVDKINSDVLEIVNEKRLSEETYGFKKCFELKKKLTSIEKKRMPRKSPGFIHFPQSNLDFSNENIQKLELIKCTQPRPGKTSILSTPKSKEFATLPNINFHKFNNETISCDKLINQLELGNPTAGTCIDMESTINSDSSCDLERGPFDRLTTEESQIKVISMAQLQSIDTSKIFADKIYIICGTGWKEKIEFKNYKRMDGKTIKNGIEIVYFRYSEHSSSTELDDFKNSNRYEKMINTVNNPGEI